jgi:hypothetical protein
MAGRSTVRGVPVEVEETPEELRRRQEENAARTARAGAEGSWGWLDYNAPSAADLTPQQSYETGDILLGPSQAGVAQADPFLESHSMGALDALIQQAQSDASGVMDHGDRAQQALIDAQHAQRMRGASDAAAADTSGSGASVQDALSSMGMLNDAMLNNYTSVYGQDQMQALDSLMSVGGASTAMRGQTFGEQFRRGQAVDAFNAANLGYQRGVEQRNTDRRTQQSIDQAQGYQQAFGNREAVRRGRGVVDDAQQQVDDAEAHREKDERLAGFYAVTGTVNNLT